MKKLIFILLLTALSMPDLFCYELPIIVYPRQIKFNNGLTDGAIDIRKNASTDISVPEYIHESKNEKFAYIKNTANRQIQASIYSNCSPIDLDIIVLDNANLGPGDINYSVDTYIPVADNYITMTAYGNVPNSVGIRTFTWLWAIEAENTYGVYPYEEDVAVVEYTTHTYYTLYGTPQAPMTEPWTDALDYACNWTGGQNTEIGVISAMALGFYNNFGPVHPYIGCSSHSYPPTFLLTSILTTPYCALNCYDASAIVYIFSKSVGCSSIQTTRVYGSPNLRTKEIMTFGPPPLSWVETYWGTHQVVYYSTAVGPTVFDPTIQLNNPIRVPVNEGIESEYKPDFIYSGWGSTESISYTVVE